jgi:hypothetical protein
VNGEPALLATSIPTFAGGMPAPLPGTVVSAGQTSVSAD